MSTRVSTSVRNAAVAAAAALVDAGSGQGVVQIYTGTQPAGPGSAATGTLLVEIPLHDPAFAAPVTGSAAADVDPSPSAAAVESGTAGWFRVLDSTGAALVDGAVPGEMTLSNTTITAGLTVTLTSVTLSQPAS